MGPKLLLMTNRKLHTRFRLVLKSSTLDDLEWPWTAKTHTVAEKMRLLEPTAQIWMKIDPYYLRQKCRPMNLVSENIRFVRILVGVSLGGGVKWECGGRRWQFWPSRPSAVVKRVDFTDMYHYIYTTAFGVSFTVPVLSTGLICTVTLTRQRLLVTQQMNRF